MTKQSFFDEAMEIMRDLEEFKRSASKASFRKQLGEEYVRRLGGASVHETLATAIISLVSLVHQTRSQSRQRVAKSPKPRKPAGYA
jgi:hypothetical protein